MVEPEQDDLGVSEPASPVCDNGKQYIIIAADKNHPAYKKWYYRLEDMLKKAEEQHIITFTDGVR